MKRLLLPLFLVFALPLFGETPHIVIKNRLLARVNQKPITVLDVVKKMDMIFYRQFPQYASSPEARVQFYVISWKPALQDLVDKELILADAAEIKMDVSAGDVRQDLEGYFGPNVIANLDEAGLSMDEAIAMLREEILVRRMTSIRVNAKVQKQITPQEIRRAYDEHLKGYERSDDWIFHVITLRDPNRDNLAMIVEGAQKLLTEENVTLTSLQGQIRKLPGASVFTQVKVSDEFKQKDKDLSPLYKEMLSSLSPGQFSAPKESKNGQDGTISYKIYYLKDMVVDEYPSFASMAPELKKKLTETSSGAELAEYKSKLRKTYPVHLMENLPSDFEPFALEVDGKKVPLRNAPQPSL